MAQSKLEVYIDILKAVAQNSPAKENKVAAQAKTSHKQTNHTLAFLTVQGLIECEENVYRITRRGLAVLSHFRVLQPQREMAEELNC